MEKNTGRKFFVGGHWRCHGTQSDRVPERWKRADEKVTELVNSLNDGKVTGVVEVVVFPSDVFLPLVKKLLRSDFQIGAQNCGLNNCSAVNFSCDFVDVGCWVMKIDAPGEVSIEMLTKLEVPWVILGHSERRFLLNETNEVVANKVAHALSHGLKVIVCVGDTPTQQKAGSSIKTITKQISAFADKVVDWTNIVLAYEPVWALGTSVDPSPAQAQAMLREMRNWLLENTAPEVAASTRIIYAGVVMNLYHMSLLSICLFSLSLVQLVFCLAFEFCSTLVLLSYNLLTW
ncbi:hypothetical protein ACLB2K_072855 [Fragaria x ananassa]